MTAPTRARIRAPWLALPVAALMLLGATPAIADDSAPESAPAAEPAPPASAPDPAPAPEPAPDPAPAQEPTQSPADPPQDESGAAGDAPAGSDAEPEPTPTEESDEPEPDGPALFSARSFFAAAVSPAFSVTPSAGLADGASVTVSVTLPATITATAGASAGQELTTGVYLMYCVQPTGTVGTAAGRATGAQCDGGSQQALSSAATPYGTTVVGSVSEGAWTFSRTMTLADAFGAHTCLDATAAADGGEQCGVFIRLYHVFNAGNVTNPYVYDTFLPVTFSAPPPPPTYGVTAAPTTGLSDGATVTVSATLPATITATAGANAGQALTTGVYLMYCVQPAGAVGTAAGRATGAQCDGGSQQALSSAATPYGTTVVGSVSDRTWTFSQTVDVADAFGTHTCLDATATADGGEQCGVFVRLYHVFNAGNVANPYVYDQFIPVSFAASTGGGTGGSGGTGGAGGTGGTGNTGSASPRLSVSPSTVSLSGATTVTITGTGYRGAGAANGVYVSIGSSSLWQPGQTPSQGGWIVSGWVQPGSLSGGAFTTSLTIPAGALVDGGSYGVATFAAHALALTNRSLDAWAPLRVAKTSPAQEGAEDDGTPAPTPPSEEGIDLADPGVTEGGEVSASAGGFEPNETGILVVVYSDPVVLASDATADADGVVRWTGRLPYGLTGSHTLTFQGSTDVGVPIEIAPREAFGCTIEGARLDWGFKESFRSYIDGSIANGEWTTSGDVGYETPSFSWTGGTGDRDEADGDAVVTFTGSVRFTGHDGALDTTIANPVIEVTGDTATLLLDVSGTTQDGRDVVRVAVPFAELDLTGIDPVTTDGVIELAGIPATLTPEGAEAFGTYAAGESLDPVTLALPEGDCGAAAGEAEEPVEVEEASDGVPWWVWLIVALVLAILALVAVLVLRRSRRV